MVDETLAAALEDPLRFVALVGPSGSGKSRAAAEVTAAARERGLTAVRVAPPTGGLDAGAAAISSVVSQLGGRLHAEQGWRGALETAARFLEERSDLLIVCDEPSRWDSGGQHFATRARDAVDLLLGPAADWPVVTVERVSAEAPRVMELPRPGVAELMAEHEWPGFVDAARRVASQQVAPSLNTRLTQRLAVAIEAWAPDSALPTTTAELADMLAVTLAGSRGGRRLWVFWQRIALSRVELPPELHMALGRDHLGSLGWQTASLALFDGVGRLHDELRRVAEERPFEPELGDATAADVHRLLFEFHAEQTREISESRGTDAWLHAAEARHHANELGDGELLDLISFELVDQLNALGTRSSHRRGDHQTSAELFLRGVTADPEDAYAQHGRAGALDVLGQEPRETEERYRHALDLDPSVPGWHADLVTFLLSLGRVDDARLAWSAAKSATFNARLDASGYDELHIRVATHLIALAELDFAGYVLAAVPDFAQDAEYRRLQVLLRARNTADEDGAFVPAPRSGQPWWEEPPQLLPPRDADGRLLSTWAAGRVESVDDEGAHVHLAEIRAAAEIPTYASATITSTVWQRRCLDSDNISELSPGRFIELGRYRGDDGDAVTVIRLLPPGRLPEPRHMPAPASRWMRL